MVEDSVSDDDELVFVLSQMVGEYWNVVPKDLMVAYGQWVSTQHPLPSQNVWGVV